MAYNDSTYINCTYPVMYVLDPALHFTSMLGIQNALTGDVYSHMPNMIIVGITNTDRTRDFTPTNAIFMHNGKPHHQTSGGADHFTTFLTQELIPYINSTYRTTDYRILNGHSFGGLYALNLLLEHPTTFNSYIANDPSIWWDNKYLYLKALDKWNTADMKGRCLYLSLAHTNTTPNHLKAHTTALKDFHHNILKKLPDNGLRWHYQYFKDEDHGTIFLPSSYKALKYIFEDYCLPVKAIPLNPELIEEHITKTEANLQYTLAPEVYILNNIASYALATKNMEGAKRILEINLKYNPQSAITHNKLANIYIGEKDWIKAAQYLKVATSLNPIYKTNYNDILKLINKQEE